MTKQDGVTSRSLADMRTCIPNELLADIVEILFQQSTPLARTRVGSSIFEDKPHWSCIHSVVLASRTLRAIGLKLWFSRLRCVFFTFYESDPLNTVAQSEKRVELGVHIVYSRDIQLG